MAQAGAAKLIAMTFFSKFGAVGAGLVVACASGAAIALVAAGDQSATAPSAAPATPAAVRPIAAADPGTAKTVYAGAKDAVAYISATSAQGQATGSGFVVSADGKIVTNEHVVDGAQQVTVKLGTDGAEQPAQVLAADASKDLALLQVDTGGKALHALSLGDSAKVQVGDATFAIGNPYGLDHTLTSGIVSALDREIQAPDGTPIKGAIQTDAAINPGNSGGALLDAQGRVIGVNSQIASAGASAGGEAGNVGIGFAIPSDTVADFVAHPTSSQATTGQDPLQSQSQQVDPNSAQPGQQADPFGQQADPSGQPVDPSGQLVDPSGQPVDPSGQPVDPSATATPELVLPQA